jgi:diaminopimelate decarboxylase
MEKLTQKFKKNFKLILEPGRIIGGAAGHFICTANDIKFRNGEQLIGVNASSAQFPCPLFYPESAVHPLRLFKAADDPAKLLLTSVYGCSTYSRDFLARKCYLPAAHLGDLLIFGQAGSYCASLYTEFLGFTRPREFFI